MKPLPNLEHFFIRESPYIKYEYNFERVLDKESESLPAKLSDISKFISDLSDLDARINGYCKKCKENRTFISNSSNYIHEDWRKSNAQLGIGHEGVVVNEFKCAFDDMHRIFFVTKIDSWSFQKIGQYYSVADFQESDFNKYRSILENDKIIELNKAVGLNAHGVGIGAYTYLRRTIDYLLSKAYERARAQGAIDEEKYRSSRVPEKMKLLNEELPDFLVEHRELYGILSLGIHELDEDECLDHFNLLKSGIEHILDDELERKRKHQRKTVDSKEIAKLYQKYKKEK